MKALKISGLSLLGVISGYMLTVLLYSVFVGDKIASIETSLHVEMPLLVHLFLMCCAFFFCRQQVCLLKDVLVAYAVAEILVIMMTYGGFLGFNHMYWMGSPFVMVIYDLFLFVGLFSLKMRK
ncbi:MAG: hypothetical protein J0H59_08955 [Comamonadaceae bacterium]|mgnify:CR=1 FL=1|nr:hypothetical protein [Comamonadaceae bacterium]